ncbi:MAG: hypothetical protein ACR2PX_22370 [Endozoicomonas sp.]|uniref:hypothetical protein n=1 Tax=Endozoicomonas sp. TaxID=1892382 RepID=UPI003D9B9F5E
MILGPEVIEKNSQTSSLGYTKEMEGMIYLDTDIPVETLPADFSSLKTPLGIALENENNDRMAVAHDHHPVMIKYLEQQLERMNAAQTKETLTSMKCQYRTMQGRYDCESLRSQLLDQVIISAGPPVLRHSINLLAGLDTHQQYRNNLLSHRATQRLDEYFAHTLLSTFTCDALHCDALHCDISWLEPDSAPLFTVTWRPKTLPAKHGFRSWNWFQIRGMATNTFLITGSDNDRGSRNQAIRQQILEIRSRPEYLDSIRGKTDEVYALMKQSFSKERLPFAFSDDYSALIIDHSTEASSSSESCPECRILEQFPEHLTPDPITAVEFLRVLYQFEKTSGIAEQALLQLLKL